MCDQEAVHEQAEHQHRRQEPPAGEIGNIAPHRLRRRRVVGLRRLGLDGAAKRRDPRHRLEPGSFDETSALAPSELRIDEYELWADRLGLQGAC